MIGFPATYSGRCGGCNEVFAPGTYVFYAAPDDVLTVVECCGDLDEPPSAESEVTPVDKVMPRGKSAADRCDRCFLVHSSGQDGCE